jgi:hypothetical protein
MNRNVGSYIFPIWIGLLGLTILVAIITDSLASDSMYRASQSHSKVTRIEMKIIDPSTESGRRVVLQGDTVCEKVNQALKYFSTISVEGQRDHSIFIDMDIYKDKKVNINILKTSRSGWVMSIGSDWYKNDSLIRVLKQYVRLD